MASTAWIVVFNIILIINSTTSISSDLRSNRCYCGFIENVCPVNLINLRYLYNSIFSSPCASNEVKYCNVPDGSISETCGQRKITVMRNKKSGEAQVGEYPWQAAILKCNQNGGYVYIGSGVLINKKHVLTVVQKVESGLSDLVIRLGEWDLSSNEETCGQQDYQPIRIIKHPNYNSDTIENNIALIILDRNVPLATTAHINTACLSSGVPMLGRCLVAGWGGSQQLTTEGSKVLRDLSVPIVDHAECQRSIQTILGENYRLPESVLCAGEGKMDSCMIDGGSPLVCESSSGQWEVVGLVSASTGCQQNVPSLYTDVSKFTSWINQQVFEYY